MIYLYKSFYFLSISIILYFYAINVVSGIYAGPSKGLDDMYPSYQSTIFSHNNKLYTYGGTFKLEYATSNFSSVSLSTDPDSKGEVLYETVPQYLPGPLCVVSKIVMLQDGHTALLVTGSDLANQNSGTIIRTYTYDFQSSTPFWKEIFAINNATGPLIRMGFQLSLAPNGKVYIYGGAEAESPYSFNELWSFDPITFEYTSLTQPNQLYRNSHSATVLPNGQIVYIGGNVSKNKTDRMYMPSLNEIDIYDTNTDKWIHINATGESLEGRTDPGTLLGPDKKTIILYGGSNIDISHLNDVLLLNTDTWVWSRPKILGDYPTARYTFTMGYLTENTILILSESLFEKPYNYINILAIDGQGDPKYSWVNSPADLPDSDHSVTIYNKMDKGTLAGIIIGSILLALILGFCAWKTYKDIYYLPCLLRWIIWNPRRGEPMWTELFRLLVQCILAFLFILYLVFSIRQVINSPTTSIIISTKASSVAIPDIRICFEGWIKPDDLYRSYPDTSYTQSYCSSDREISCDEFLTKLDMQVHTPVFSDSVAASECHLFAPPSWFRLGDGDEGNRNGTKLHIKFSGNMSVAGTVRITQYPPGMDPNVKIYKINTTDVPQVMSEQAIDEWGVRDMQGKSDPNTFIIYTNDSLTMQYQVQDHQYLEETGWNQLGLLARYNHTPEISSSIFVGDFNVYRNKMFYSNEGMFGTIDLYPSEYATVVQQDQKIHSILNSLGSVGGILSLILGIQAWLFGFRPKSPWGIVQHFSCGFMKRSLGRGLQKKFDSLDTPVPFVSLVNNNFDKKQYNSQIDESNITLLEDPQGEELKYLRNRMCLMERRVQLTERLLEAYYVDDEVFRELSVAIDHHKKRYSASKNIEELP
ncbi:hypothetical protein CLU79DRAFT_772887 [Phycomyces nitens]|nr:hypothetical protein CLU79DRAFT_772887 [Phycomyces nitens]